MRLACCLLAVFAPFAALAGDGVDVALQAARTTWPEARITANATTAICEGSLQADAPTPARNGITQVRVRCMASPTGWTRYIALRVEQQASVAVLRAPLAQGQPLSADLILWEMRDVLRQSADVLTPTTRLAYLTARRALPAGSVLTASQFIAPQAIQRGQSVTLLSRASGMEVRAPGEALSDAALGARVKVRNKGSQRVVEGIARFDGLVEVGS